MHSAPDSFYSFAFVSASSGDRWFGTAIGDSTLFETNQFFRAIQGTYLILGENPLGYDLSDAGYRHFEDGAVYIHHYFESTTNQWHVPYQYSQGQQSGWRGIGSELDYIIFANGQVDDFGQAGWNEAEPAYNYPNIARRAVQAEQVNLMIDVMNTPSLQTGDINYGGTIG